jgi:hypothetical protein
MRGAYGGNVPDPLKSWQVRIDPILMKDRPFLQDESKQPSERVSRNPLS